MHPPLVLPYASPSGIDMTEGNAQRRGQGQRAHTPRQTQPGQTNADLQILVVAAGVALRPCAARARAQRTPRLVLCAQNHARVRSNAATANQESTAGAQQHTHQ